MPWGSCICIDGFCKPKPPTPTPPTTGWGEWTPWSDCDKILRKMFRTRVCHKPTARNGAASCPGRAVESKDCPPGCQYCSHRHEPVCGVDGKDYKNDCWATCEGVLVGSCVELMGRIIKMIAGLHV